MTYAYIGHDIYVQHSGREMARLTGLEWQSSLSFAPRQASFSLSMNLVMSWCVSEARNASRDGCETMRLVGSMGTVIVREEQVVFR